MEGKINQANENRKRRMMHQPVTHHTPKYRPNPSPGFAPRTNSPDEPSDLSQPWKPKARRKPQQPLQLRQFQPCTTQVQHKKCCYQHQHCPEDWKQCCACCSKGQVASDLF